MEKEQKQVLIVIGVILAIFAILALVISALIKREEKRVNPVEPEPVTHKMNTEISLYKTENTILSIQSILNNYFELLSRSESNIINILDEDYIRTNNITEDNVISILNTSYGINSSEEQMDETQTDTDFVSSIYFIPKKVYSNSNSDTIYYFIDGYIDDSAILDVKILIIVTSNKYVIVPLDKNISDLENYAKNYNIIYKEIKNENSFSRSSDLSEENKITLYINEFKNLLIRNPERAYNMLYKTGKAYTDYKMFLNNKNNIYEKLSIRILESGKSKTDDYTLYTIYDYNNNRISIYEYSTFNFLIDYEFDVIPS